MSKLGLHHPFEHLKHKLWPKVKLAIWFSTTKSQESIRFPCVQVTCDIPLESSWQGLQLFYRLHLHQKSTCEVMVFQSHGSPNLGNFETPTWESRNKKPFGCGSHGQPQSILKGARWWLPPVRAMVNLVCSSCLWLVLARKVFQLCTNHFVLVLCRPVRVSEACQFFLVPSRSSNTPPLPLQSVANQGACLDSLLFHCFLFGTHIWILQRVGSASSVLFVHKKDGTLQMCVDYRVFNKVIVKIDS
jgi:hypothetical protein